MPEKKNQEKQQKNTRKNWKQIVDLLSPVRLTIEWNCTEHIQTYAQTHKQCTIHLISMRANLNNENK